MVKFDNRKVTQNFGGKCDIKSDFIMYHEELGIKMHLGVKKEKDQAIYYVPETFIVKFNRARDKERLTLGQTYANIVDRKVEFLLSNYEFNKMIKEHQLWISSNGAIGHKTDLNNVDMSNKKLLNLDLRKSIFENTNFTNSIIYADLRGADLTGSSIENTTWTGSNLLDVKIEEEKFKIIKDNLMGDLEKHKYGLTNLKTNQLEVAATKE